MLNFGGLREGDAVQICERRVLENKNIREGIVEKIYPAFIVFKFPYIDDTGHPAAFRESYTPFQMKDIEVKLA